MLLLRKSQFFVENRLLLSVPQRTCSVQLKRNRVISVNKLRQKINKKKTKFENIQLQEHVTTK